MCNCLACSMLHNASLVPAWRTACAGTADESEGIGFSLVPAWNTACAEQPMRVRVSVLTACCVNVCCRLSKELSRELQQVVVGEEPAGQGTSAAAFAAANGEAASILVAGQPTAVPAALSTEAAAAAAVGTGAVVTRRRGWFSRGAGKGSGANDGPVVKTVDAEEKVEEEAVKVRLQSGHRELCLHLHPACPAAMHCGVENWPCFLCGPLCCSIGVCRYS